MCFEGDVLVETIRAVYAGDKSTILVIILILLAIVAVSVGVGCYLCAKQKCCKCFISNCACCVPKKYFLAKAKSEN